MNMFYAKILASFNSGLRKLRLSVPFIRLAIQTRIRLERVANITISVGTP